MKLLNFLVESFVGAFGITKPKPEQQRTVALALGGFLLVFFAGADQPDRLDALRSTALEAAHRSQFPVRSESQGLQGNPREVG